MDKQAAKRWAEAMEKEKPQLVICGGGHVGYQIAQFGKALDFKVIVIDDREDFANEERFNGVEVICKPFNEAIQQIEAPTATYFAIVTRGHEQDSTCLQTILDQGFKYVGMMGSRVKRRQVMAKLQALGYDEALLQEVHAPIGIDCEAQTPAEIAISVVAELIQVKNTTTALPYPGAEVVEAMANGRAAVLASIIEKKGSAPRGSGSVLVLTETGEVLGTVGGGSIEKHVIERAKSIQGTQTKEVLRCNVGHKGKDALNMICGGEVHIQLETIC